ncbi:MAG: hypothetical protein DRP45_04495 [Candidatus Zixiibacteriota bacterium]|nr:MAG: hypothetical protein DRP45_04495 [candidate division Zixibacteria bacterium]
MCDDTRTSSGARTTFVPYETRRIVYAEGAQGHDSDYRERESWRTSQISALETNPESFRNDQRCMMVYNQLSLSTRGMTDAEAGAEIRSTLMGWGTVSSHIDFLQENLRTNFQLADDRRSARYANPQQQVTYEIEFVDRKSQFKTALETEGIIVIYVGHSRYGRGACFDQYSGSYTAHGDLWEDGTTVDNGLFRLGYPYIPVELSDMEHHHYHFEPIAVETPKPSRSEWRRHPKSMHPEGRRRLTSILLPENLRQYVKPRFASPSHRYWGLIRRGVTSIILIGGWNGTVAAPADLGSVEMRCRTICHFGCSSRKHFWDIVRRPEYKGYQRPRPPTERLAYFTTAPTNSKGIYWLYFLLSYNRANGPTHWWDSHEFAKRMANRRLRRERLPFRIY